MNPFLSATPTLRVRTQRSRIKRLKQALKAEINKEAWESLYDIKSQPFAPPETGKIAVKVINHYGDEILKVYDIKN